MWLWGHKKYHVTFKVTLTLGSMARSIYILSLLFGLSILNSTNSWPRYFKYPTIVVEKRNFWFRGYYVINIFKLEYLRYLLSNWDQAGFGKTSLEDMTSFMFQLRIFFLFYVGLSHNLVKEIWVVHMTLRSYIISCEIEDHVDLRGQLQGKYILFLYRLVCQFITPPILDRVTSNFQLSLLKKGTSGFGGNTSSIYLNWNISVIYYRMQIKLVLKAEWQWLLFLKNIFSMSLPVS